MTELKIVIYQQNKELKIADKLGIPIPPLIKKLTYNNVRQIHELAESLKPMFGEYNEGIYIKQENDDQVLTRCKWVRKQFKDNFQPTPWWERYPVKINKLDTKN